LHSFHQRERFAKLQRLKWFKVCIQSGVYRTSVKRNVGALRFTDATQCQKRVKIGKPKPSIWSVTKTHPNHIFKNIINLALNEKQVKIISIQQQYSKELKTRKDVV